MMNDIKKNELTEAEMENISGGTSENSLDFIINAADQKLYDSFSSEEKELVKAQPDRAAKRAKMFEIWKSKTNIATPVTVIKKC